MALRLYEINEEIRKCFHEDPDTGEFTTDLGKLNELEMIRDKKLEDLALYALEIRREKEAVAAEEKRLKTRREGLERHEASLREFLQNELGGEIVKTDRVKVSYRNTQFADIKDISKLPMEYLKFAEPEAKKADILRDLKNGVAIEGAAIGTRVSMMIK